MAEGAIDKKNVKNWKRGVVFAALGVAASLVFRQIWSNKNNLRIRGVEVFLVESGRQCNKLINELQSCSRDVVGMDCEWRPRRFKNQKNEVAVIQISNESMCLVIRIKSIYGAEGKVPKELKRFLEDPSFVKCGVGIAGDVKLMKRCYEVDTKSWVDLNSLLRICTNSPKNVKKTKNQIGLAKLTNACLSWELDKNDKVVQSNWEEPLSRHQISYAACDAIAANQVFNYLYQTDANRQFFNSVLEWGEDIIIGKYLPAGDVVVESEKNDKISNTKEESTVQPVKNHLSMRKPIRLFLAKLLTSKYLSDAWVEYETSTLSQLLENEVRQIGEEYRVWMEKRRIAVFKVPALIDSPIDKNVIGLVSLTWNRVHYPPICREAHGAFFIRKTKTDPFVCIKTMMPRGIEVLTELHRSEKITETQDIKVSMNTVASPTICECIRQLSFVGEGDEFQRTPAVSLKVCGVLIGVTCYPLDFKLIYETMAECDDPLQKLVQEKAEKMKLPFLPVLSTRQTMLLSSEIYEYVITALGLVYGSENLASEAKDKGPLGILAHVIEPFLNDVGLWYEEYGSSSIISCFCFEFLCPTRSTWWGRVKDELQVSYPKLSGIWYLGRRSDVVNFGPYIPFSEESMEKIPSKWRLPAYWRLSRASEVMDLVKLIQKCTVDDSFSPEDFFREKPVLGGEKVFHPEGLVLIYPPEKGWFTTDQADKLEFLKVKTPMYHHSKEFRRVTFTKVHSLLECGEQIEHFYPTVKYLRCFQVMFWERIVDVVTNLLSRMKECIADIKDSEKPTHNFYHGLSAKAQGAFLKYEEDIQAKILINKSSTFETEMVDACLEAMPILTTIRNQGRLSSSLKRIIMSSSAWRDDEWLERVSQKNMIVIGLFNLTDFQSGWKYFSN